MLIYSKGRLILVDDAALSARRASLLGRTMGWKAAGGRTQTGAEAECAAPLARGLSQAVSLGLRRRGGVLRERYHLRVLRSPTQVRHALRYVLLNSRRHQAKRLGTKALPAPVRIDPASSGRWFRWWKPGSVAALEAARPTDPPAVRPPPFRRAP